MEENITDTNKGVSVIICCYNSAARLPETLRHLAGQNVPANIPWEVLVINNASKDNTVDVAKQCWQQFQVPNAVFKIIEEPRPGQMHARKRGAIAAAYECIIFCDDDNWLHQDYVRLAKEMLEKNAAFGAGGGQNVPTTDAENYPEWFDTYKDKYAIGIPAEQSGDVSYKGFVLGAGLVTKKSLFLQVNDDKYPSLLNGRNGEKLSTGDDFEYCKKVLLWDYKLYYDDRMKLTHFIPKERLTIDYRERLMDGIMQAGEVLYEYDIALQVRKKTKDKNRWRLLMMAPIRILFARLGWVKRDVTEEQLKYFYLAPYAVQGNRAKTFIKKFLYHQ